MIDKSQLKIFPFYNDLKPDEIEKLLSFSAIKKLDKGQLMMGDSGRCNGVPLILKGSLRLFRVAENGREINVYNVHEGELCILAAVCILADLEYEFSVQAQTDCVLAVLPPDIFKQMMTVSESFKNYVFNAMADKLITSLRAIEVLNFSSIEERLKDYLYYNADKNNEIIGTHEMIARDIGSSREVISRHLKKLENEGLLIIKRGKVLLN
jgi:CRP/FNR family transcriptional regulator, anaerobic regulatory protein